jgi:hypothetical protein
LHKEVKLAQELKIPVFMEIEDLIEHFRDSGKGKSRDE